VIATSGAAPPVLAEARLRSQTTTSMMAPPIHGLPSIMVLPRGGVYWGHEATGHFTSRGSLRASTFTYAHRSRDLVPAEPRTDHDDEVAAFDLPEFDRIIERHRNASGAGVAVFLHDGMAFLIGTLQRSAAIAMDGLLIWVKIN
jgi:hypothetical protein